MNFRNMIKIVGGVTSSIVLLINLSGCSNNHNAPSSGTEVAAAQPSPSFASSTICAENPFLQKYQCSFRKVEQAARSGEPDAEYALGYLYYYGIGTTQDRQTGLVWIRKAAAQGQTVAQEALRELSGTKSGGTKKSASSASSPSSQASVSQPAQQSNKPLTDYLPNYGEKRINATTTPPPNVDLSSPPQ